MNNTKVFRAGAAAFIVLAAALFAYRPLSGSYAANHRNKTVYKTDVLEKADYSMPGIELDDDTARLIDFSKSIAVVSMEKNLVAAQAALNEQKNLKDDGSKQALATFGTPSVMLPTVIEESVQHTQTDLKQQDIDRPQQRKMNISIKSVFIPGDGKPSAVIAIDNGQETLVREGAVLENIKISKIESHQITVTGQGKTQVVYVTRQVTL
ncbi:hypothetical protein [Vibrio quintilis]|uniref:Type IV pilus biogenesis n=1 Tax=Vibrio quintilis TaxID=1117707 RepID=A0A1M7YSG7_9VIBR|nr:hypothetical protein [Vibrio quintilis]SHO55560.1 hypothetical protein VQ7734_01296 [Vibrio quintilis]